MMYCTSLLAPQRARAAGFSLIEVLIALLVLALGVLTVAGLQVFSKKSNHDALQRSTASLLAYDILERMRVNSEATAEYLNFGGNLGGGSLGNEPVPNCRTANCDEDQLARHDLWAWETALDGVAEQVTIGGVTTNVGGLQEPTACIRGPGGGGDGIYTVAIAWRGTDVLSDPAADVCGRGSGKYGDNDEFRRLMVVRAYIGVN